MAVEDAAVLAECLSQVTGDSTAKSLRTALTVFEKTRHLHTTAVQEASLQAGNVLHLRDGPEQEARDAAMKSGAAKETTSEIAYGLADMRTRDRCYGYDAVREARKEWARTIELINPQR
jgi:salicylate hydroxylase